MCQFIKLTKIKIKIVFCFLILSFLFSMVFNIFNKILVSNTRSEEELVFLIHYVLPIPFFLLVILKFYLFACLAIYFINKKNKLNYKNAKN